MNKKRYLNKLGKVTLKKLLKLHFTYNPALINQVMIFWFGWPDKCLLCKTKLTWTLTTNTGEPRKFSDIDAWFCMKHCPVDNNYEWIEKIKNEKYG